VLIIAFAKSANGGPKVKIGDIQTKSRKYRRSVSPILSVKNIDIVLI